MDYLVIYLHGFLSSPQSHKAQQTMAFVQANYPDLCFEVPKLANYPAQAAEIIEQVIAQYANKNQYPNKKLRFIGSSLGGFLSTYMCEKYAAKGVLINPAVKPYELLMDHLGEQENYHTGERVNIEASFMDELKVIEQTHLTKKNYRVMLQTDDEVLDYQQAEKKYQGCQLVIEQGGDHSFINFQAHLPDIMRFFIAG